MKTSRSSAFTLAELFIVIVTLVVCLLALAYWLPSRAKAVVRGGPPCSSNQRQVVMALSICAHDHEGKFPMQVSIAQGGTKELALQGSSLASFATISNELCDTPKLLRCPQDSGRVRATNFARLSANNLSYFLSMDASETNASSVLLGDRNLCINGQPTKGFVEISNPGIVTWGTGIHVRCGNVGLADGSAHHVTDLSLQKALQDSGIATNRFAIP